MAAITIARVWFNTREAADYTGAHLHTIQDACAAGELKAFQPKKYGHWKIHVDDLDRWIRGGASC